MPKEREPIAPNPPRWKPSKDPASIHVPGLDTNAPVHDQIEQIEQLITIKLQNIDENFSRINSVLANKLLPAVKRYAVGTEPVREAAKFWTSFYEQAAQIRIPTSDDHSTVNELSTEQEYSEATSEHTVQDTTETDAVTFEEQEQETSVDHTIERPSVTHTESSFHPNQDAFSSTPARSAYVHNSTAQEESWSTSLESPFVRLSNEVKNFSLDEGSSIISSSTGDTSSYDEPTPATKPKSSQNSLRKGKNTPLRENLLRHQLYSASDTTSFVAASKNISPLKTRTKPKTPLSRHINPYVPQGTDSSKWSGVVDLRDPTVTTPHRSRRTHTSSMRKAAATPKVESSSDSEDDFGLPPGMSPPIMMSPVRLPRNTDRSKIAPTPSKNASARIKQDILRSVAKDRQLGGFNLNNIVESSTSMSSMPSPPSFSRYRATSDTSTTDSLVDQSFSSMMRRVGLDVPDVGSTPAGIVDDSKTPVYDDLDYNDSLDDLDNMVGPSAAFLMATQGMQGSEDDSFGSSNQSGDSLNDEVAHLEGPAPVHPFAVVNEDTGFDDDSDSDFDDYQPGQDGNTETLFGVPPGQRQGAHPLQMHAHPILDDITETGAYLGVEESPTPAGWGGNH